jgi:iron complex outermembrane receptor protein
VDRFGQPVTGNAQRTRHIGIELTGKGTLAEHFEFGGNITLSQNRFVQHTDYSTGTAVSLNKNPIAGFPDVLANVRLTYRLESLSLSLSGRFVGKQYTDNLRDEANTVDPYFVSDGFVSYTLVNLFGDVNIEAKLQVNNMFDCLYAAYGEGSAFFVGAERNVFFNLAVNL